MTDRKEFEAAFPQLDHRDLLAEGVAAYIDPKTQGAWEGWLARGRRLTAAPDGAQPSDWRLTDRFGGVSHTRDKADAELFAGLDSFKVEPLFEHPAPPSMAGEEGERLAAIGELIRTQDNRITDSPIFIVQQKRERVADPDYDCDRIAWVNDDGQEADAEERERLEARYRTEFDEPKGWRRLGVRYEWEFVTACFTELGCKDYLKLDGHNLREPRIYAAGSYRNEEWRFVRKQLIGFAARAAEGKGS